MKLPAPDFLPRVNETVIRTQRKRRERSRNPHAKPGCTCHWADYGPPGGWQIKTRDIGCPVDGPAAIREWMASA